MQRLEDFILENRADFDNETPDLRVWAKLNERLEEKVSESTVSNRPQARIVQMPSTLWSNKLRIAASVAGLLMMGIGIGFYIKSSTNETGLAAVSAEYGEMERFYQQQIEKKTRQLASVKNSEEVKEDLNEIDLVMNELRTELTNAPKGSREQIIRNMITSYKNKMYILERVLDEKQQRQFVQTNTTTNNKNEKDTI
jgi:hypothetical protein